MGELEATVRDGTVDLKRRDSKITVLGAVARVLNLRTNRHYIPSFVFAPRPSGLSSHLAGPMTVEYHVCDDIPPSPADTGFRFHSATVYDEGNSVRYERQHGPFRLWLRATGLVRGSLRMEASAHYAALVRSRINTLYPPGRHLADLTVCRLIREGFAPLHCSAVVVKGNGIVMVAPPDVGKTYTALKLVREFAEVRVLSEDMAVTDGQTLYGCPLTASVENYGSALQLKSSSKWRSWLGRVVPPLHPFVANSMALMDVVDEERTSFQADPAMVVFLRRGSNGIRQLQQSEAIRRLAVTTQFEFHYLHNPLLLACAYYGDSIELEAIKAAERAIYHRLVRDCTCLEVTGSSFDAFWPQIARLAKVVGQSARRSKDSG